MLEISISREMADTHAGFMAGCVERGRRVEVFENAGTSPGPGSSETLGERCDEQRPSLAARR